MNGKRKRIFRFILAVIMLAAAAPADAAEYRKIGDPPTEGEFVIDLAEILDEDAESEISGICTTLIEEMGVPIITVTFSSMQVYAALTHSAPGNYGIERMAENLLKEWSRKNEVCMGTPWNSVILFLVAVEDRKARIEMGSYWGTSKDPPCVKLMDKHIVFHFKRRDYAEGVIAGVTGLDRIARGKELPRAPHSTTFYVVWGLVLGFVFASLGSMIFSGTRGWGWNTWATIFRIIGKILYHLLSSRSYYRGTSSRSSWWSGGGYSGGGGFSGGGFSGGSSGGATGSW